MNPRFVIFAFRAVICAVVLCGCDKPPPSGPTENVKSIEKSDPVEASIKRRASSDAFEVVKAEHASRAGTLVQDNFRIEDVNVVKLSDGGYTMMCSAYYEFVLNGQPDHALSCSDQVNVWYDKDGKPTGKQQVKALSRKDLQKK
jgi:hypothetical protein